MNNTMKLCNFRDCTNGDFPPCPHNAVDPCKVFRHAETGHWYHEATGEPIRHFRLSDGTMFDTQMWLEQQIIKAANTWKMGDPVHETFRSRELNHNSRTMPAARAPKHSNEELDAIADNFIRNKADRRELVRQIKESGMELHGLVRMQKTWGDHPLLAQRIKDLREQRDAMRQVQSEMDKGTHQARKHLRRDDDWTNKWRPKRATWDEFVLVTEHDNRVFVIDRHGLKTDGRYIYLPDNDSQYLESALYAEQRLGIVRSRWEKLIIPTKDTIGAPARRYGKRNANGRRIRARTEQRKYAYTVIDTIKALRQMHVSVFKIRDNDELFKFYLENIAPRLSRG